MKNSGILRWANNKNNKNSGKDGEAGKKWIHAPDTLVSSNVVYLVKFLGSTDVDKPKGIDVVKQGIQRLKFNQQLRKSEGSGGKDSSSGKTPKVELTISVEGVAIQEPKTKQLMHQYPLHKISYCADDKAEKRFFSFIAKEGESGQHTCFVFVSDKLAEEITLTIGQAFELAYKKFLDTSGKEMEAKKQFLALQKRVALLEGENTELKKRLREVANIKGQQDVQEYMHKNDITEITEIRGPVKDKSKEPKEPAPAAAAAAASFPTSEPAPSASASANELICLDNILQGSSTKLDGLSLDDLNDDDFNPRAAVTAAAPGNGNGNVSSSSEEDEFDPRSPDCPPPSAPAVISPPPSAPARAAPSAPTGEQAKANMTLSNDIFAPKDGGPFSKNPFSSGGSADPFGMSSFSATNAVQSPKAAAEAFQAGLSGAAFTLADLDPLKK